MNDQTNMAQLRYLEELKIGLVHAGFEPERIEDQHLPVRWENHYLCRVSGRGSVLYRQENVDGIGAQDALQRILRTGDVDTLLPVQHAASAGDPVEAPFFPSDGQMLILDALRLKVGVYQADFEFLEVPELRHVGLIVHFEIPLV